MESVEGTVAEHHEDIPFLKLRAELLDDPFCGGLVESRFSGLYEISYETFGVKALLGFEIGRAVYLTDDDTMGSAKALGNSCWKTARRVVFERGSKRAQSRDPT